jgi:hypothetical protein
MKAGWHGHPISDGSHDGPTCAYAPQSILVFQGRPPSACQRFVNLAIGCNLHVWETVCQRGSGFTRQVCPSAHV